MIVMKQEQQGRVLNDFLYIGDDDSAYPLVLRTVKGETMKYGKEAATRIDFPGEYDIQGIGITCMDAGGSLHYVLKVDDTLIALLFNKAILEKESFDEIEQRRCADESIKSQIEKMELDGDVYVFGEEARAVVPWKDVRKQQAADDEE